MAKKAQNYTKPELRERLKKDVIAGSKGGRPGQWSARKAQLLAHEYEAQGGGYSGPKQDSQKHLDQWTQENWRTADGKKAERTSGTTHETARYLPDKAWDQMSAAEKKATDKKKRAGSRKGKQFVSNTGAAKKARKTPTKSKPPKTKATRKKTTTKSRASK